MYELSYTNQAHLIKDRYLVPNEQLVGELVTNLLVNSDRKDGVTVTIKPTDMQYIDCVKD